MAKQLLVHIGDPKTGSTSIQRTLFERRWDCPTVSLDYPPVLSALGLANVLKDDTNLKRRRRRYKEVAEWIDNSSAQVVVLSAEQFSSVEPATLKETLETYLPDYAADARILAYARPHASRFLSSYAQRTKTGSMRKTLDEFFADPSRLTIINLHKRFAAWHSTFGNNFMLRPMVRSELRDGDVVADFLGIALNGAPFTVSGDTEANVSISGEALSGLQAFQSFLRKAGVDGAEQHAIGNRVNNLVSAAPVQKGTKLKLHKALYQRLLEHCYDDSDQLDREFFDKPVMVQALIQSEKDTVAEAFDMDAKAHYPAEALATLDRHARAIAVLLKKYPSIWHQAHKRDKGRLPGLGSEDELPPEAPMAISEVDAHLAGVAAILIDGWTSRS